ncbi:UDP-N-acetylglucosamine 2-epimerase [Gramella sp. KN1008]|uniref:UDP-N-acetylglucosamine 2-epimerase n=1 Tax=Gramella sp. KN1008 TaxID=2529298 RepID=UPI00103F2441|nr:UDP-N-acetylglucosamine 2-epimerase [Gramella sp. KN1008]TBW25659.1 UDP-N-acetylglucosamine 2-epimerase (hydrolyzing) [Gramella sp. KN1008]
MKGKVSKKILFITGTRADFGKLKSLMQVVKEEPGFEYIIFATGMHLQRKYGYTVLELEKAGFKNIRTFENHTSEMTMDLSLAKTIEGLSSHVKEENPDLIVVHGDRIETLAGAIVGSLNNILVAHIEGGELSGTIDELIRHSVTKLSHVHFVANDQAKRRLIQMGELESSVFKIGSPDIDIMFSENLPALETVKEYYEINFEEYAIAMFHPVTTEADLMEKHASNFVNALLEDNHNYVVIYPNNDRGTGIILQKYERLENNSKFRIIPSLRFEYFLSLLKNAKFIIGNSSAGIREAHYYKIPSVNIGTRQKNRSANTQIINCDYSVENILKSIDRTEEVTFTDGGFDFGNGDSAKKFLNLLQKGDIWDIEHQKQFRDLN